MVIQVLFRWVDSRELFWVFNVFHPADMIAFKFFLKIYIPLFQTVIAQSV
jgi:hypothetical protein